MSEPFDWDDLRAKAVDAAARAYAPYSRLHVGVAAITDDGRLLQACNVENASYGLGLCAECGLVSQLHSSGGGDARRAGVPVRRRRPAHAVRALPPAALGARGTRAARRHAPRRPADDRGAARRVRGA